MESKAQRATCTGDACTDSAVEALIIGEATWGSRGCTAAYCTGCWLSVCPDVLIVDNDIPRGHMMHTFL